VRCYPFATSQQAAGLPVAHSAGLVELLLLPAGPAVMVGQTVQEVKTVAPRQSHETEQDLMGSLAGHLAKSILATRWRRRRCRQSAMNAIWHREPIEAASLLLAAGPLCEPQTPVGFSKRLLQMRLSLGEGSPKETIPSYPRLHDRQECKVFKVLGQIARTRHIGPVY
jgi:hypothetical protein